MHILATAGHVDHGKSALVAALTGKHPDRLKEEQIREMTIDLGFAFYNSSSGEEIGIIDVPGHIDFIDNMLAGMGGIEGVLLVIAADEGIMPQTREHLAILDLLGVTRGIIALTKIDLVNDSEWMELIEKEIRNEIDATSLKNSPIICVSAKENQGIDELKTQIEILIKNQPVSRSSGNPRLPIDRVFTIQGFGTVVTGTLLDGTFENGNEIEILPEGIKSRIRNLQVHNVKVQKSFAGSRTAVNLVNVNKDEIKRGSVLTKPGTYSNSSRIDVSIRLLRLEGFSLAHDDHLNFFTGTAHRLARVRLLDTNRLLSGESGYLQLELNEPLCMKIGDHFILRKASPSITVGGGVILETHPKGRYKLHDADRIAELKLRNKGSIKDLLLAETGLPISVKQLEKRISRDKNEIESELALMVSKGIIKSVSSKQLISEDTVFISTSSLIELSHKIIDLFQKMHNELQSQKGFLLSEISKKSRIAEDDLVIILDHLVSEGIIQKSGQEFNLPGHSIKFSPIQEKKISNLWAMIDKIPFAPPTYGEISEFLGKELLQSLIRNEDLIRISEDIVFRKKEFEIMLEYVKDELKFGRAVTVMGIRDRFETSRKYALPFLEHLDRMKITRRVGDEHIKF